MAWIRPISQVFESTTYVVSIILASFMLGLGAGSACAGRFADRLKNPLGVYVLLEAAIAAYCFLLLSLFPVLPQVNSALSAWHWRWPSVYMAILFFCIFLLLALPTALMGATFPLLARVYVGQNVGKGVGELYFSNNAGAVLGSLAAGFFLVPTYGIATATLIAALFNLAAAILALLSLPRPRLAVAVAALAVPLAVFASRRYPANILKSPGVRFFEEGLYGSVAVLQYGPGGSIFRLLLNGQGSSSLDINDLRVSSLSAFLPLLFVPRASEALVIGFGTGAASNILSRHSNTTTVELEPKVLQVADYFSLANAGVLSRSTHRTVFDDARNFLLTSGNRYDIIVNHPLDPHQSSSALLFTKEFMAITKGALNDGGVYVQWLPLYHLSEDDFLDFFATLRTVYPYYSCFANMRKGEVMNLSRFEPNNLKPILSPGDGGELIIVASDRPLDFSDGAVDAAYARFSGVDDKKSLALNFLEGPRRMKALALFDQAALGWSHAAASLITDDRPSIEFSTPINKIAGRRLSLESVLRLASR